MQAQFRTASTGSTWRYRQLPAHAWSGQQSAWSQWSAQLRWSGWSQWSQAEDYQGQQGDHEEEERAGNLHSK